MMALCVIAAGFSFRISAAEWCFVVIAIAMVISCEACNTAIEFLSDRISTEIHPLTGKAKDVAAAAVLIASAGAAMIGVIIFAPKLWRLVF